MGGSKIREVTNASLEKCNGMSLARRVDKGFAILLAYLVNLR